MPVRVQHCLLFWLSMGCSVTYMMKLPHIKDIEVFFKEARRTHVTPPQTQVDKFMHCLLLVFSNFDAMRGFDSLSHNVGPLLTNGEAKSLASVVEKVNQFLQVLG